MCVPVFDHKEARASCSCCPAVEGVAVVTQETLAARELASCDSYLSTESLLSHTCRALSLTAFRLSDATMKLLACFEPPNGRLLSIPDLSPLPSGSYSMDMQGSLLLDQGFPIEQVSRSVNT